MATRNDELLKAQRLGVEFKTQRTMIEGKANKDFSNVGTLPEGIVSQLKGETGPQGPAGADGSFDGTLKTINGESLIGFGDIVVSSGTVAEFEAALV